MAPKWLFAVNAALEKIQKRLLFTEQPIHKIAKGVFLIIVFARFA